MAENPIATTIAAATTAKFHEAERSMWDVPQLLAGLFPDVAATMAETTNQSKSTRDGNTIDGN